MKTKNIGLGLVLLLLNSGLVFAEDVPANTNAQEDIETVSKKFCPVCGPSEEMEGLSLSYKYNGKKYGFCSMDCLKTFKAKPEKFIKEIPELPAKI